MSFTFDVIINPVILLAAVVGGVVTGFAIGRIRLAKSRSKVKQLENELLTSHMETLEAQRAYVMLEIQLKDQAIPVIPMKINGGKENSKEKVSK